MFSCPLGKGEGFSFLTPQLDVEEYVLHVSARDELILVLGEMNTC